MKIRIFGTIIVPNSYQLHLIREIQVRVREIDATKKPESLNSGTQIGWKLGMFFSETSKIIYLSS